MKTRCPHCSQPILLRVHNEPDDDDFREMARAAIALVVDSIHNPDNVRVLQFLVRREERQKVLASTLGISESAASRRAKRQQNVLTKLEQSLSARLAEIHARVVA